MLRNPERKESEETGQQFHYLCKRKKEKEGKNGWGEQEIEEGRMEENEREGRFGEAVTGMEEGRVRIFRGGTKTNPIVLH